MKRKTVIKSSSLPAPSPVSFAAINWLLLERWDAPGWAYGVLWTIVALAAINWVYNFFATVERDVPGFGEK
jgi:hypothetical protein